MFVILSKKNKRCTLIYINKIPRSSAGAERARLNSWNRAGARSARKVYWNARARSARALKKYERAHP